MLILQQNRGRLRIALGDHAGLEDVRVAAHGLKKGGVGPCMWPWRTFLALALAGEGDREEARRLAQEEAALTRPIGAHRAFGISLRAAGIVEGGDRGIEMLQEAVAVLDGSPAVLEHARALVDLGSALRRAGHRRDALHHLREGLDLASRCGAGAVAARARAEIVAAGAKPRRDAVHGRDALTASELRVARMAAEGMTNRDIAQALFVSLRTVETHLTHAYHKLSVSSRDELSTTVGPDTPDDKAGADRSAPA